MDMEQEHTPTGSTTRGRRPFVRELIWMVVFIFVICMAIISIAWLVMNPHDPSFRVMSLSVTNFTASGSQLRGKYEVELNIGNQNKKVQVILDRFEVFVFYCEVMLSVDAVQQPIYIEKMTNKSVKVELGVVRKSSKVVVPEGLVKEWNKGVVNFNLKMGFRVRFEAGIWPSREKLLNASCVDLYVEFSSPKDTGKLLGIGKDCHIVTKITAPT
ncbi:NDR1/HIN1-like protein 1 [Gastrolobium bilobum]|uniref:NDR1/HIN1-like protein 1 n=1 Tax=Gastrolobium bilobum TaxID=150636 RepID=UPI002AB0FCB6|nr:NDR1/HIN1-like protein 1 [Gastrolobium bilobum]